MKASFSFVGASSCSKIQASLPVARFVCAFSDARLLLSPFSFTRTDLQTYAGRIHDDERYTDGYGLKYNAERGGAGGGEGLGGREETAKRQ